MVITAMLATFLWGSAFPFIKLSYHMLAIGPHQTDRQILFAGYRFFLAALMIFAMMKLLGHPVSYRKQTLIPCLRIALFQTFLQYVCFYVGLAYTTGIHASILAGTGYFFQILFAHWMYPNDKIDWRKTAGLITGFSGVWLANLSNGALAFSMGIGSLLVLASAMSGSFGNLLARNETHRMGVFYLTAWQMLIGSIGLIAVGAVRTGLFPFHFDMRSLLILLYLAFVSATGFLLWNLVMRVHPVSKVSLFLFLIPLFGSLLSSVLLHESFSPYVGGTTAGYRRDHHCQPVSGSHSERRNGMSGQIELNGVPLYVQSVGEGSTVALLHGMPLDHRMWDETVKVLHRRYRVIRYDLRGVGRSGDAGDSFSHHDDLHALLERLEVDRASIVGISVGGKIAIDFALRYPHQVRNLVLINPGLSGYRWSDAFLSNEREIQRLREAGQVEQALERFLQTWVEGPFRNRSEVVPSVRQYVRQTVLDYWKRESKGMPHFPPAVDRLAEISVPTLVIRGDRDWEEIQSLAQFVASSIPQAELITITGTGHFPPLEQPDAFHAHLIRFLERHAQS